MRTAKLSRETLETNIEIELLLEGDGVTSIDTGIGFMDHMLTLLGFHSSIDLRIKALGDLEVDTHHTVEDIGIALGEAISIALGDKRGIKRFSHIYLPMDESLVRLVLDISGRSYLEFRGSFIGSSLGAMSTQDIREFLMGFSRSLRATLHIEIVYGLNDHHVAEAIFKGLALLIRDAVRISSRTIPSSKGGI